MVRIIGLPAFVGAYGFGVLVTPGYISDFYYSLVDDIWLDSDMDDLPYLSETQDVPYYSSLDDVPLESDAEAT